MVNFRLTWTKTLMIILMLGMIVYGRDDDAPTASDRSAPDPAGTLTYTLINSTFGCEENPLIFADTDCSVILTNGLNLQTGGGSIMPAGEVKGLGNITEIPAGSVWSYNKAGAGINQGYIIRLSGDADVYYRVFVSDWRDEYGVTENGATYTRFYCTIKYQGPFTPAS